MVRERSTGRDVEAQPEHTRLCVATRAERSPADLIRFVAGPDNVIVPDLAHRLPGRGVWVTADRQSMARAVAGKSFAKSLKRKIDVPADLPDQVEALLMRRVGEALSLANKAGVLITGFEKISRTIAEGRVCALVHGSDAAEDGRSKLDRKFLACASGATRNTDGEGQRCPNGRIVAVLTVAQMSLAIARPNVVHAGLKKGGITDRFLAEAGRLQRYRSGIVHRDSPQGEADESVQTAKLDA
ncbi:MAG TPA: RNA-binding protein [Hyphomicrobiaceae bacterium]|nr:RNA-binding protein [Hyphomicrobiaceae bacterium]MCC0009183.1 RNA-binding protein [Hyphomicrobiaceae bacterium]HRY07922.1 RNA-binding protein [Hyphomicrobiaceae bacterium]